MLQISQNLRSKLTIERFYISVPRTVKKKLAVYFTCSCFHRSSVYLSFKWESYENLSVFPKNDEHVISPDNIEGIANQTSKENNESHHCDIASMYHCLADSWESLHVFRATASPLAEKQMTLFKEYPRIALVISDFWEMYLYTEASM